MPLFVIYLFLCVAAAYLGRNTRIGAGGFFVLALMATPITALLVLLIAGPKNDP